MSAAIAALYLLRPPCPIRAITHIPCPTCGIARAAEALVRGDFGESFDSHPLTVPAMLLVLFAVHSDRLKVTKRTRNIILAAGSILIFAVYLYRLLTNSIP